MQTQTSPWIFPRKIGESKQKWIANFQACCHVELPSDDHMYLCLDCLGSFTGLEHLTESEWYYCVNCKRRQHSTKQLTLHTLPNVSSIRSSNLASDFFQVKFNFDDIQIFKELRMAVTVHQLTWPFRHVCSCGGGFPVDQTCGCVHMLVGDSIPQGCT